MQALFKMVFDLVPWWLWPLALFVALAVGLAVHEMGRADLAAAQAAMSDLQRETAKAATLASEAAREKETMLLATTQAISDKLNQEQTHAQALQNRLVSDLRSGAQRLSIAAHCPQPGGAPGANATPADSTADTPRAELDPATAETLVGIAADGDAAIVERNACIDAYNAARETLNTTPGP